MNEGKKQALIEEGRNQVLYLMLCIGDENVAHDHWHPDRAHILYETRVEICQRLKSPGPDRFMNTFLPSQKPDGNRDWPDFEKYTYCAG